MYGTLYVYVIKEWVSKVIKCKSRQSIINDAFVFDIGMELENIRYTLSL